MAVETNWKEFLSEDSELPPDVSIRVKGDGEEGGGKIFNAHKILLAAVSPVFRKQFFGPMKETAEVVEMKETGQPQTVQVSQQDPDPKEKVIKMFSDQTEANMLNYILNTK